MLTIRDIVPSNSGDYSAIANDWGTATSRVARIEVAPPSRAPGSLDLSFRPVVDAGGGIATLLQDDAGNTLITGNQSEASVTRVFWQRFSPAGQLDTNFSRKVEYAGLGAIRTTAIQPDGKILFGGSFPVAIGRAGIEVVRMNADGTQDLTFQEDLGPNSGCCLRIAGALLPLPDGKILLGRAFDLITGQPPRPLLRLNPNGSLDQAFSIDVQINNTAEERPNVQALVPDGAGGVFVGGYFQLFGGQLRNHVAHLLPDGNVDPNFVGDLSSIGFVEKLILQSDGRLLVGGSLHLRRDGQPRSAIRLHRDGTIDPTFTPSLSLNLRLLTMEPGGFIFATATLRYDPPSDYVTSLVRLFPDGRLDPRFTAELSPVTGLAGALPQANGDLIIAGGFTAVNDVPQQFLARIRGGPMDNLHLTSLGFGHGSPSFYAQIPAGARYSLDSQTHSHRRPGECSGTVSGMGR
ncbi:MAG: delta-60 repeat domain-containing protein [Verrucomicrobiales bacterium]|nr:delta-60 repeat domain-containing protein [Verrucomicrobiales bacterium]